MQKCVEIDQEMSRNWSGNERKLIRNDQNWSELTKWSNYLLISISFHQIIWSFWTNSSFLINSGHFWAISAHFLRFSAHFCSFSAEIWMICTGYHQRSVEAASCPSPAGPACPSRNIGKSLIFLGFLRGAASRGSGQPRPAEAMPSWPAEAGGHGPKCVKITQNLHISAEDLQKCVEIDQKMSRNWSELTKWSKYWLILINFHQIIWSFWPN